MRILPLQSQPPSTTVDRRHTPRPTTGRFGYQGYRACLRWEFGFTCAFCLLHESDFVEHGAEGLGLLGVEHFLPVAEQLRVRIDVAGREIRRHAAIPRDADPVCRCGRTDHHLLPFGFAEQLLDIPLPG